MALFKVRASVYAVIEADTATKAIDVFNLYRRDICNEDYQSQCEVVEEIVDCSQLSHGWCERCLPYGSTSVATIGDILRRSPLNVSCAQLSALAAAIGLVSLGHESISASGIMLANGRVWNPTANISDAMELATALCFRVESRADGQSYVWLDEQLLWNEFAFDCSSVEQRMNATKRAIVRAALHHTNQLTVGGIR